MALEVRRKARCGWSSKFSLENTKTSHKLPILLEKAKIDYSTLKKLCCIEGLGNRKMDSTKEAHDTFMKNYSNVFQLSAEKLPELKPSVALMGKLDNNSSQTGSNSDIINIPFGHRKPHYCKNHNYSISHNIQDHLVHKQHVQTKEALLNARINSLRKQLRKLPFERKRSEQENIFKHLRHFPELTHQIPFQFLKELSTIVQLEKWNEAGYTVFGNNDLYLILKGNVVPLSEKYLAANREDRFAAENQSETETETGPKLIAGQCFGTLNNVKEPKDDTANPARISTVVTLGPCEFLKISGRDFEKMKKLVESKETSHKFNLIQSCRLFENWPKGTLNKVVDLIRWRTFRAGQVLVNEGESCQMIGFINEGMCLLKRSIEVAETYKNGTKGRRQKQVTVGRLGPGGSFGECTVLRDEAITYSIVTATHVQLGIISQQDIDEVDELTKCLLSQCYDAIDNNTGEEELQKQYMEQTKRNEWIKFKRSVIRDVIFHSSILPGYGKWSRNPTIKDVVNLV